jgi:hypothetical protein
MVTRVVTSKPRPTPVHTGPAPLIRPEVRDALARCLYDGPGDPLAHDATDHRPDAMRMSGILRSKAEKMLAALAAAGLVITEDGDLARAA